MNLIFKELLGICFKVILVFLIFCSEKQMTGFYIKRNTGLNWVK